MTSSAIGHLPLAFYASPADARLFVSSRAQANEILSHYEGMAPTYIGLGRWRLVATHRGAGTYEITCKAEA